MSLRFAIVSVLALGCAPSELDDSIIPTDGDWQTALPGAEVSPTPSAWAWGDDAEPVDADGDGSNAGLDCDDADASVYPGAPELCDDVLNDCDHAWTAALEIGRVSIETADGRWTDATGIANGVGALPGQPARLQISAGSTLWLCEGSWSAHVYVGGSGTIASRHGADTASIGGKGGSVVTAYPGALVTIDGVTITSGTGTIGTDGIARGGAIYGEDARVDVLSSIIVGNMAGSGGGAWLGAGEIRSTGTDWGHGGWDNDPEDLLIAGKRVPQAPEDFACSDTSCDITEE